MSKSWGSLMLSMSEGSPIVTLPLWQTSLSLARPCRQRTNQTGQSSTEIWAAWPGLCGSHRKQRAQPWVHLPPTPLLVPTPRHTGNTAGTHNKHDRLQNLAFTLVLCVLGHKTERHLPTWHIYCSYVPTAGLWGPKFVGCSPNWRLKEVLADRRF